jgi:hypothetical protein
MMTTMDTLPRPPPNSLAAQLLDISDTDTDTDTDTDIEIGTDVNSNVLHSTYTGIGDDDDDDDDDHHHNNASAHMNTQIHTQKENDNLDITTENQANTTTSVDIALPVLIAGSVAARYAKRVSEQHGIEAPPIIDLSGLGDINISHVDAHNDTHNAIHDASTDDASADDENHGKGQQHISSILQQLLTHMWDVNGLVDTIRAITCTHIRSIAMSTITSQTHSHSEQQHNEIHHNPLDLQQCKEQDVTLKHTLSILGTVLIARCMLLVLCLSTLVWFVFHSTVSVTTICTSFMFACSIVFWWMSSVHFTFRDQNMFATATLFVRGMYTIRSAQLCVPLTNLVTSYATCIGRYDRAIRKSGRLLRELEMVARGYQLTSHAISTAPMTQIDHRTPLGFLHYQPLRTFLAQSLQRHVHQLCVMSRGIVAVTTGMSDGAATEFCIHDNDIRTAFGPFKGDQIPTLFELNRCQNVADRVRTACVEMLYVIADKSVHEVDEYQLARMTQTIHDFVSIATAHTTADIRLLNELLRDPFASLTRGSILGSTSRSQRHWYQSYDSRIRSAIQASGDSKSTKQVERTAGELANWSHELDATRESVVVDCQHLHNRLRSTVARLVLLASRDAFDKDVQSSQYCDQGVQHEVAAHMFEQLVDTSKQLRNDALYIRGVLQDATEIATSVCNALSHQVDVGSEGLAAWLNALGHNEDKHRDDHTQISAVETPDTEQTSTAADSTTNANGTTMKAKPTIGIFQGTGQWEEDVYIRASRGGERPARPTPQALQLGTHMMVELKSVLKTLAKDPMLQPDSLSDESDDDDTLSQQNDVKSDQEESDGVNVEATVNQIAADVGTVDKKEEVVYAPMLPSPFESMMRGTSDMNPILMFRQSILARRSNAAEESVVGGESDESDADADSGTRVEMQDDAE